MIYIKLQINNPLFKFKQVGNEFLYVKFVGLILR